MKADAEEKREEAISFLVDHDLGVLATVSRSGTPRARTVYYACDDSFTLYFLTYRKTRKVDDFSANPHAAFVVSEAGTPQTIQIEGTVTDITDSAELDPLVTNFLRRLTSLDKTYGAPLTHLDSGEFAFYRLTPAWVRWGDFTFGEGTGAILTEVPAKDPEV